MAKFIRVTDTTLGEVYINVDLISSLRTCGRKGDVEKTTLIHVLDEERSYRVEESIQELKKLMEG